MKTKRVNFSIPEDINNALLKYSESSLVPKSKVVSKLIAHFLSLKEEDRRKMLS